MAKIALKNRGGQIQLVEAGEEKRLLASGDYALASQDEYLHFKRVKAAKQGGIASKAGAALEGAARGLTLGASDAVLGSIGGDDYSEEAAARKEAHPGVAGSTELIASVAPALASGGSSLAVRGGKEILEEGVKKGLKTGVKEAAGLIDDAARATAKSTTKEALKGAIKYSPAGLVAKGASSAGSAVERVLLGDVATAGAARKIGAKAAGMATEGAIEGAVVGGGQAISEASLGNEEITAEKILAGMGSGAVFGAGFGGVLGAGIGTTKIAVDATMDAGRSLGSKILGKVDDVATSVEKGEVPEVAKKAGKLWQSASEQVTGDTKGLVRATSDLGNEGKRIRNNYFRRDDIKQELVTGMSDDMDRMIAADKVVRQAYAGELKLESVARDVQKGYQTVIAATDMIDQIDAETTHLLTANGRKEFGPRARQMRDWVRERREAITDYQGPDPEANAFIQLDALKRRLQNRSKVSGRAERHNTDPDKIEQLIRTRELTDDLQERLRVHLEDENVYGTAATHQRIRNEIGKEVFGTGPDVQRRMVSETSERLNDIDWQERLNIGDRRLIDKYVGGLADYRNQFEIGQTSRHIQSRIDMYNTLIEQGDVTGVMDVSRIEAARDAAVAFQARLRKAQEFAGDIDKIESLQKLEQDSMLGDITDKGGAVIAGAVAGGPLGAMAGSVLNFGAGTIARPSRVVKQMAALEALQSRVGSVDASISSKVAGYVSKLVKPARAKLNAPRPPKVFKPAKRAIAAAATKAFYGGDQEARRQKFEERRDQIKEYASNPAKSQEYASSLIQGMDLTPTTAFAMARKHAEVMLFLGSKLPQESSLFGVSLQPHLYQAKTSDAEVARFNRFLRTAIDPLTILDDLDEGRLTTEGVESLRVLYPHLFQQIQRDVLAELQTTKKALPYQATLQLSLLFDIPGHPTLENGFMARQSERMAKSAQQEAPKAPAPRGPAPQLAKDAMTTSQRISAG